MLTLLQLLCWKFRRDVTKWAIIDVNHMQTDYCKQQTGIGLLQPGLYNDVSKCHDRICPEGLHQHTQTLVDIDNIRGSLLTTELWQLAMARLYLLRCGFNGLFTVLDPCSCSQYIRHPNDVMEGTRVPGCSCGVSLRVTSSNTQCKTCSVTPPPTITWLNSICLGVVDRLTAESFPSKLHHLYDYLSTQLDPS